MLLKKYMVNYIKYCVLCKQCSNMKTILQRDKNIKKLICNNCKTNYYFRFFLFSFFLFLYLFLFNLSIYFFLY